MGTVPYRTVTYRTVPYLKSARTEAAPNIWTITIKYTLQDTQWLDKILTHFIYLQYKFYTNIDVNSLRMTHKAGLKPVGVTGL